MHRPKPQEDMNLNYMSNETFISMFPNLNTLASICFTILIGTASVEWTHLRNCLSEVPLAPDKLSNTDLEKVVHIVVQKK